MLREVGVYSFLTNLKPQLAQNSLFDTIRLCCLNVAWNFVSHFVLPCLVTDIGIAVDIKLKDTPKPEISVNLSHFVQLQIKTE